MSNHTIGNRRGSVRGAPPDVYMGFASGDVDSESMDESIEIFGNLFTMAVGWTVLFFIVAICWATGVIPDEMAD